MPFMPFMPFAHRLPVVLSTGVLLSASLLAVAQEVPRALRGATTPILTGTTLASVESMDGNSYLGGYPFFSGQMTVTTLANGRVLLGSPSKVFDNNGTGLFTTLATGAVGTVQIPDLNGDGFPEFLAENGVSTDVFLGLANGTRSAVTVSNASSVALGKLVGMPVVGDFNGDLDLDLFIITSDGTTSKLSLLAGEVYSSVYQFSASESFNSVASSSGPELPLLAQSLQWSSTAPASDSVYVSAYFDSYSSATSFTVEVRTSGSITQTLVPPSAGADTQKPIALTTGDIDNDGFDDIALILSTGTGAPNISRTLIYKGGALNVSTLPIDLANSSLVIVADVTGDGIADLVGSMPPVTQPVPAARIGLFPGRSTLLDGGISSLQQASDAAVSVFPASRTFADQLVGTTGPMYRAQAVPLLTPDVGNTPGARQLLLGDFFTPLQVAADVLRPKSIPALQPSFTGISTAVKTVNRPNTPLQVCSSSMALVFGNANSTIDQLTVTMTTYDYADSLTFAQDSAFGIPTISPSTYPDYTLTAVFPNGGTAAEAASLLKSMRFVATASSTSGTRTIAVATKASFSASDVGSPYASTVELATIDANYNTQDMGSVKAGGTLTATLMSSPELLRYIPYGSTNFVITAQPTHGTALISNDVLEYTSDVLTGGPATDEITVTYDAGSQGGARGQESIVFLINNTQEALGVVAVDTRDVPGVGKASHLRAVNGHAPYTVTVRGGTFRVGSVIGATSNGINADGDGQGSIDVYQDVYVTPTVPFDNTALEGSSSAVEVNVVDADGTGWSYFLNDVVAPAAVAVAVPQIPVSVGGETLFGAICPSTLAGVASLRSSLSGRDTTVVRAFAWDAAIQAYAELPAVEPAGGLLPTTGVFLAARENIGLDFNGVPSVIGAAIELQPGWNFVGLGPIDNNGVIETSHPFLFFDIRDDAGTQKSQSDISALPYYWDGAQYSTVTAMTAGVSYWINNRTTANIQLVRQSAAVFSALRSRSASTETPPAPPSSGSSESASGNKADGGCGAGSGIALVLAGLLAFARFARFRR